MNIFKPIGTEDLCAKVEEICANPLPYKISGIKPPHFAVNLDPGNGRTTLLEYISDMYKQSDIIAFTGGVDDYLEITLDGSLQQLKSAIAEVRDAAFYTNGNYTGVVGIDPIAIASHQNETQYGELMSFIDELNENSVVVLLNPVEMTLTEEKFIAKVKSKLEGVVDFGQITYSDKNYADICTCYINMSGVYLDSKAKKLLFNIVKSLHIGSVSEAITMGKKLLLHTEYAGNVPTIGTKEIKLLYNGYTTTERSKK